MAIEELLMGRLGEGATVMVSHRDNSNAEAVPLVEVSAELGEGCSLKSAPTSLFLRRGVLLYSQLHGLRNCSIKKCRQTLAE